MLDCIELHGIFQLIKHYSYSRNKSYSAHVYFICGDSFVN